MAANFVNMLKSAYKREYFTAYGLYLNTNSQYMVATI